jgi:hypothetical protein
MRRGTIKRGIKKYTAIIPKTAKAAKNISKMGTNRIKYFLKGTKRQVTLKAAQLPKKVDSTISTMLRSFTKKHGRK